VLSSTATSPVEHEDERVAVSHDRAGKRRLRDGAAVIFLAAGILTALLVKAMTLRLDHDEHQFIAGAWLVGHARLVPYRDFAFFHTPYLLALYAVASSVTPFLLLSARLISVAFGAALLALVWTCCRRAFDGSAAGAAPAGAAARGVPTAAIALLLANPLFFNTSGRAWNHDVPVLLTMLALGAARRAANDQRHATLNALLSGFAAGLATGTRLTFAPTILAVACAPLVARRGSRGPAAVRHALASVAGFALALLPVSVLVCLAPRQFWFDTFTYPLLNLEWRRGQGVMPSSILLSKLNFMLGELIVKQPGTLAVVILFAISLAGLARRSARARRFRHAALTSAIMAAALLVGAVVPTPSFQPYFYAPIPFMLLTAVFAAAGSDQPHRWSRWFGWGVVAAAPFALYAYGNAAVSALTKPLVPIAVHDIGLRLAPAALHGRPVLTVGPIFALEGGLPIYPGYATGPFAFRIAPLVDPPTRRLCHVPFGDALDSALRRNPPGLVLLRGEDRIEGPLRAYAQRHRIPLLELHEDRSSDEFVITRPSAR
jgi:hypothetical protein